jgi:prepilin-type N-terminal cleavage/methylation domain-containing protein
MTTRNAGRRGFTLLELVVALTITGVAVSAGYAVLAMLADRRDRITGEAESLARAAAVRGSLLEWLGSARVDQMRLGASFQGIDRERDGVPDDELTFLTAASTPLGAARTLVRITVARDSADQPTGLFADFRDWDGTRTQRLLLDSTVAAMDLRFNTRLIAGEPAPSSWSSGSLLPASVELLLTARDGRVLPPLLTLPLFATIEGGR